MFKLLFIITFISLAYDVYLQKDGFVTIKSSPMRGAMVDQYDRQVLIIRLKSPSDVLKDSIAKMDKQKMRDQDYQEILRVLGNIELHFQKQFKDSLAFQSELIASPYPIRDESGNGKIIDISGLHRQKRQIWRALFSFLRLARPAARVAGKLTKYGKFLKVIKYGGYAASAAVFAYELADIFGAVPDHKYNELTQQLAIMHDNRLEDLKVMRNITLLSINSQNSIKDLTIEVDQALGQARDRTELSILVSQIFSSYLQQLTTGLMLLMNGKIPSFFLSLETQIRWLETKLPGILVNEISSITPHLSVTLKGIDSENNQLIILVEVPKLTSSFQILNFVEWEPEVISNKTCYTSPRRRLFLAFPPGLETNEIKSPLLIEIVLYNSLN